MTYGVLKARVSVEAAMNALMGVANPGVPAVSAEKLKRCEIGMDNALSQYPYLLSEARVAKVRSAVLTSVADDTALVLPEVAEKSLCPPLNIDPVPSKVAKGNARPDCEYINLPGKAHLPITPDPLQMDNNTHKETIP